MADKENMDLSEEDVMKRVLGEHHLDAERALAGLVRTLVHRHLRCKRDPRIGTGGQGLRPTILDELIHIICLERDINKKACRTFADDQKVDDPAVADEDFIDGVISGNLAAVQQALVELLLDTQRMVEAIAGLEERDEDEDPPPMKLVTD